MILPRLRSGVPLPLAQAEIGLLVFATSGWGCGQLIGIADVSDDETGVGADAGARLEGGLDSAPLADGANDFDAAAEGSAADANGTKVLSRQSVTLTAEADPRTIEVKLIASSPYPYHAVNLLVDDVLLDVE